MPATHVRGWLLGLRNRRIGRPPAANTRQVRLAVRGSQTKDDSPVALTEATPSQPPSAVLSKKQEGPSSDLSIIIDRLQTVRRAHSPRKAAVGRRQLITPVTTC